VTQENDVLKLELTIDRTELERQLGQAFPMMGGAAGGGAGGREGRQQQRENKRSLSPLIKLGGIGLGITALVKSSKVAQGVLGSLQSILGGFVDVFLAQFMPLIGPALQGIAKALPQFVKSIEPLGRATERFVQFLSGPFSQAIAAILRFFGVGQQTEAQRRATTGAALSVQTPGRARVAGDPTKLARFQELQRSRGATGDISGLLPTEAGQQRVLGQAGGAARLEAAAKFRARGMQQEAIQALNLTINVENATTDRVMQAVRQGMDQLGFNPNDKGLQLGGQY